MLKNKNYLVFSLLALYLALIIIGAFLWIHIDFGRVNFEQLEFFIQMPIGDLPLRLIYRTISIVFGIPSGIFLLVLGITYYIKKKIYYPKYFLRAGLALLAISLFYAYFAYDFSSYYKNQLSNGNPQSTFYEEYYVNPKTTKITSPGKTNNLIIISIESFDETYSDKKLFEKDYIESLSEVKRNEISLRFEQTRNTHFTISSLVATQTGIPLQSAPIGTKNSFEKLPVFLPNAYSLGQILEEKGYSTFYICGTPVEFNATDIFLKSHGFSQSTFGIKELHKNKWIEEVQIDKSTHGEGERWWGIPDSLVYELFKKKILVLASEERPFYAMMSTMDTHGYDGYKDVKVPNGITANPFGDIVYFSAQQAADFVRWVKEQPFGENTTIIIIGDHLAMGNPLTSQLEKGDRTIFNVIINSKKNLPENKRKISHFDLFPTALESIGFHVDGGKLALGVSIYSNQPTLIEKLGNQQLGELASQKNNLYRSFLLP